MITCPQCFKPMVKSYTFQGMEFDYCRDCKKELAEMSKAVPFTLDPQTAYSFGRTFHDQCRSIQYVPPSNSSQLTLAVPIKYSLPVGRSPSFAPMQPKIIEWVIPPMIKDWDFPPRIWIPWSRPTAYDNFYGIDRTMDPARLAGLTYQSISIFMEESIQDACLMASMEGGQPCSLFLHSSDFDLLKAELGLHNNSNHFRLNGPTGPIKVWPDLDVTKDYGYLLQMDTWERNSVFGTYCVSPGYNTVIKFR